jgi:2-polyprenyl-3-methyl-5-hydroxy-6-metoxy-1,4-benzoquinol methylase
MIGSLYYRHPEILLESLSQMNDSYTKNAKKSSNKLMRLMQQFYIFLFGIPEIGFQVRSMYYRWALGEVIKHAQPKKVLDAGSGIGNYVFDMARGLFGVEADGWEIDRRKLQFAKDFADELKITNAHFSYGDITKKPKIVGAYDFVVNVDVLEHVKEYKKALTHLYVSLKPGGYLFIHTPQAHQKRFFRQFETWEHEDHVREGFEPDALRRDLERIGFEVLAVRNSFGFFGSLAWELNHLLLGRHMILAGLLYPFLYVLALLDPTVRNSRGLCFAILARKKDKT